MIKGFCRIDSPILDSETRDCKTGGAWPPPELRMDQSWIDNYCCMHSNNGLFQTVPRPDIVNTDSEEIKSYFVT